MISMRIPRKNDKNNLKTFLIENGVLMELTEEIMLNSMIVEEGKRLIGFSNYVVSDGNHEIQYLLVHPDYRRRKLGDGLIRAILNLIDRRGIKKVYITVQEKDVSFINYVGLDKVEGDNQVYKAVLPDFFEKPCGE